MSAPYSHRATSFDGNIHARMLNVYCSFWVFPRRVRCPVQLVLRYRQITATEIYICTSNDTGGLVDTRQRFGATILSDALSRSGAGHDGLPVVIPCDQGTAFTSVAMDHWAYWNQVRLGISRPGRPGDNAIDEAFNGSTRRECLLRPYLLNINDAKETLENGRIDDSNERPLSRPDQIPTARFRAEWMPARTRQNCKNGGNGGPRIES